MQAASTAATPKELGPGFRRDERVYLVQAASVGSLTGSGAAIGDRSSTGET